MKLSRVRLTVRHAMALMACVAVGLAAIRHAITSWGPRELATVAPIIVVATNALAWFQRPRRQVFWIGFGLAGWAYLALALWSPLAESLPTSWLLEALHGRLYEGRSFPGYDDGYYDEGGSFRAHGMAFVRAGHSIIGLVLALLGGFVAVTLVPVKGDEGATSRLW